MKDEDTGVMETMRMWLFYVMLRKAQDFQPAIYGIPTTTFHETLRFHPQVRLYFLEDLDRVEEGYSPVEAEVTFRLVHETPETMTAAKAHALATKVRELFCSGHGMVWKKGRELWLYKDTLNGYDFQLYAWNEAEAKKVIEQVLDILRRTPDWDNLKDATRKNDESVPSLPGNHLIYGKQRRKPRFRPVAYVRFRYAEMKIHGLFNDITLVDRTGFRHNPLIRAD